MRACRGLTVLLSCLGLVSLSCGVLGPIAPSAERSPLPAATTDADGAHRDVARVARFLRARGLGAVRDEADRLARVIVRESRRAGLATDVVLAVIEVESGGDVFAVSRAGALGLMQLMPATGEALAPALGIRWKGPATLLDPEANVLLGVEYLRQLTDRYGDLETALVAYNWGPTRISQKLRRGEALPREYRRRVREALGRPLHAPT